MNHRISRDGIEGVDDINYFLTLLMSFTVGSLVEPSHIHEVYTLCHSYVRFSHYNAVFGSQQKKASGNIFCTPRKKHN